MEHSKPLDGLRAIAVLVVMVGHAGLGTMVPGGFGVTIFFFLSGYLITTQLLLEWNRDGRINLRAFYLRRAVRILPPMVICILFALGMSWIGLLPKPFALRDLAADFLFLTNYASLLGAQSQLPIPLWSLDVEEHFYLLFPLLFLGVIRRGRGHLLDILLVLLTIALALRIVTFQSGESASQIYFWSHTRFDSILYGSALAVFNNPAVEKDDVFHRSRALFLLALVWLLISFTLRNGFFRETFRYSVQGVALFFVFNYSMRDEGRVARLLSARALKVVADYSYVLYLIHVPMLMAADHVLAGVPWPIRLLAGFAISFAFAAVMHSVVEQPLLRWRKANEHRFAPPVPALAKATG